MIRHQIIARHSSFSRMKCATIIKTALTAMVATSFPTMSPESSECVPPETKQPYQLLERRSVSPDSCVLKFALPTGRAYLGWEADIPTCISIIYPDGTDENGVPKILAKSYSPISHPSTTSGTFDLLVKGYEPRPGGGVGAYLCGLQPGDCIVAKVKKPRIMHGSSAVAGRWKHVGLIAGGTGIAPLLQIITILLNDPRDDAKIYVLSINRSVSDILMKNELDQLVQDFPDRVRVTYALTGGHTATEGDNETEVNLNGYFIDKTVRRGSVDLAVDALPPPTLPDTMILVCGKDGFVSHWGGPIGRGPKAPDGTKGPKVQGPLLGVLKEAGYDESQVFKY